MSKPINFVYGITTVPLRLKDHIFVRTLNSLKVAGFDEPRIFVDGAKTPKDYEQFGLDVTVRDPAIHITGNWILSMWELYLREPFATRYIVFQDDIVVCKNLKQYLRKCKNPEGSCYYNLCTYPSNFALANGHHGWYLSNQRGKGAQALMFDHKAVRELLGHPHLVERMQDARRGLHAIDGGVANSLTRVGFKEYVHNPSLVFHTGKVTTKTGKSANKVQPDAQSFRGEEFDSLELLSEVT